METERSVLASRLPAVKPLQKTPLAQRRALDPRPRSRGRRPPLRDRASKQAPAGRSGGRPASESVAGLDLRNAMAIHWAAAPASDCLQVYLVQLLHPHLVQLVQHGFRT